MAPKLGFLNVRCVHTMSHKTENVAEHGWCRTDPRGPVGPGLSQGPDQGMGVLHALSRELQTGLTLLPGPLPSPQESLGSPPRGTTHILKNSSFLSPFPLLQFPALLL